jgi:uncharacterized SAM-binding protein YcdF (DUF218 family)
MRKKYITNISIALVLLSATLFLIHDHILLAVGDFLVVQDKLQPADVIHVIAGPDHRTDYGINLYQLGYGRQIFFTGGWCTLHNEYHGQRGRERAFQQGATLEAVAIDDSQVTSTYSEVVRLKEFIAQSQVPIQSVIAVSDPHHMRRARWTYRTVLGSQVSVQMAPVPFNLSPYRHRWWTDVESREMVGNEYIKIFYYYVRYGLDWDPVTELLAAFDIK